MHVWALLGIAGLSVWAWESVQRSDNPPAPAPGGLQLGGPVVLLATGAAVGYLYARRKGS